MEPITIQTTVHAPIEKTWDAWTNPDHIKNWAFASPDWHAPHAENDLTVGGKFVTTMAARDGSASFDFTGTYTTVVPNEQIDYVMDDGRKVSITFRATDAGCEVIEIFDPEPENPVDMQRAGWQAILDNFKSYTESL